MTVVATGGTTYEDGDYTVHVFTTSGTLTVTSVEGEDFAEAGDYETDSPGRQIEYLVVGAGGAGGGYVNGAGGGGGGQVRTGSLIVGVGGLSVVVGTTGLSSIGALSAAAGGTGSSVVAGSGGSGGSGAGGNGSTSTGTDGAGGTGTAGNDGGAGHGNSTQSSRAGGGGGGAGADGTAATAGAGGAGGAGVSSSISGTATTYGGGGGGGARNGATAGAGGSGGGGAGTAGNTGTGTAGTANTGGGGGGGPSTGGAGGSGIVIVRYVADPHNGTTYTLRTSQTFVVTEETEVDYVIHGGDSSGTASAGGVAAGTMTLAVGEYMVVIGAGGAPESNGSPTTFDNITVPGGIWDGVTTGEFGDDGYVTLTVPDSQVDTSRPRFLLTVTCFG